MKNEDRITDAADLVEQLRSHHKQEILDWDMLLKAATMIESLAAQQSVTGEDDVIGLAVALEQRRALAIVAAVRALRLGKGRDPMMPTVAESHFDLACEEIEIRLRTEQWTLDGVDMPLPTSKVPPAVKAFGKGDQVVIYGLFDGSPAVVIYPAEQPGEVGVSAQREKASVDANLPDAVVLTFPTIEQAQRVSDALVNAPAAQQSMSPVYQVQVGFGYWWDVDKDMYSKDTFKVKRVIHVTDTQQSKAAS